MADPQYVTSKAFIVAGYASAARDDHELRLVLHERVPQYLGEVLAGDDVSGLPAAVAEALTALRGLIDGQPPLWLLPTDSLREVRDAIEELATSQWS